jgi:hypothetical protein
MLRSTRNRTQFLISILFVGALLASPTYRVLGAKQAGSAGMAAPAEKPFVVEYYYKVKWGHAEEFIALFKKNHYPVLKKEIEFGRMLKVYGTVPRYHTTEDGRWDYRMTIVYKSAAIAHDDFDSAALLKQLYPDQEIYKREEQRRFEILDAHWDLPIKDLELEAR